MMQVAISLFADSGRFRDMAGGEQVLDLVEARLRSCGATAFVATGLPLPGRPLAPLVLRASWGATRADRDSFSTVHPDDPLLQAALDATHPFEWPLKGEISQKSALLEMMADAAGHKLVVVPVRVPASYQGCLIIAGPDLSFSPVDMVALGYFATEAFTRLKELDFIRCERQGDLSARERRVLKLSAAGNTASEIARLLTISQRTVHAHLQNASDKLRARNKTQTVVEAVRYGQIDI